MKNELINIENIKKYITQEYVYMITAYHPNIDKWEKDMKTRRENNEVFYV